MPRSEETLESRVHTLEVRCDTLERMLGMMARPGASYTAAVPEAAADDFEPVLLSQLTTKQHVALQMLIAGKSNLEIAERFGVTENGAKVYLRAIYKKFEVHTRSQAVMAVYDEWERTSEKRYLALTKGIPKSWHMDFLSKPIAEDPHRALYEADKED